VDVYGALFGSTADASQRVEELVGRVGVGPDLSHAHPHDLSADTGVLGGARDADGMAKPTEEIRLSCKSEFFGRPMPSEAVEALLETFMEGRTVGESRELDFMSWGGAYNCRRPEDTAFVHRDELFQLKHAVTVGPDAPAWTKAAAHQAATRSWPSELPAVDSGQGHRRPGKPLPIPAVATATPVRSNATRLRSPCPSKHGGHPPAGRHGH
jgi:hypothetical protein